MNGCTLTTAITAIANSLACGKSIDEINLLGVVFSQLGDTLQVLAAQKTLCEQ